MDEPVRQRARELAKTPEFASAQQQRNKVEALFAKLMSLVDFHCAEYSDGKGVADQELRRRIVEIGIRKTARATKTDSKTVMLISRGARVKPSTLARVIEFVAKEKAS